MKITKWELNCEKKNLECEINLFDKGSYGYIEGERKVQYDNCVKRLIVVKKLLSSF